MTIEGAGTEIRVREDIDEPGANLRIDAVVLDYWSRGLLRPHFATQQHALGFGRRTLDVSTHLAIAASEELLKGRWRDEWAEVEKLSQVALDGLNALMRYLSGDARTVSTTTLLPPLRQMNVDKAQVNADTMIGAAALLRELASFSVVKGDDLAGRKNPGDPVKATFVHTMAEGWLTLTGSMPGSNTSMSDNPFMRFAAAGWVDAGGSFGTGETLESVKSFGQSAISSARQRLALDPTTRREDYRPTWA